LYVVHERESWQRIGYMYNCDATAVLLLHQIRATFVRFSFDAYVSYVEAGGIRPRGAAVKNRRREFFAPRWCLIAAVRL